MSLNELFAIIGHKKSIRAIDTQHREQLKLEYMKQVGAKEEPTCTSCFWNDLMTHFRIQLKQNGYFVMESQQYMIKGGSFRPYGSGIHYINSGTEDASHQILTDKIAEALLKKNPDLKSVIVKNPNYKPAAAKPNSGGKSGTEGKE